MFQVFRLQRLGSYQLCLQQSDDVLRDYVNRFLEGAEASIETLEMLHTNTWSLVERSFIHW